LLTLKYRILGKIKK